MGGGGEEGSGRELRGAEREEEEGIGGAAGSGLEGSGRRGGGGRISSEINDLEPAVASRGGTGNEQSSKLLDRAASPTPACLGVGRYCAWGEGPISLPPSLPSHLPSRLLPPSLHPSIRPPLPLPPSPPSPSSPLSHSPPPTPPRSPTPHCLSRPPPPPSLPPFAPVRGWVGACKAERV